MRARGEEVPRRQQVEIALSRGPFHALGPHYILYALPYPHELLAGLLRLESAALEYGDRLEIELLEERPLPLVPYVRPDRAHVGECKKVQEVQPLYVPYLPGKVYYEPLVVKVPVLRGIRKEQVVPDEELHEGYVVLGHVKPLQYAGDHGSALLRVTLSMRLSYVMEEGGKRGDPRGRLMPPQSGHRTNNFF